MNRARSRDGTIVAFDSIGTGPPLVLVHGTCSSALRWAPVIPLLERDFTLHIVERRGRGLSGDGPAYDLAREVEDVVAVVEAVGEVVGLLGHSFGGLVSLEAMLATPHIGRLAVYEPPVAALGPLYPKGALEDFEAKLAAGDREGVVVGFFTDVLRVDDDTLAKTRALPSWQARLDAAHTLPREIRATDGYAWAPARFANAMRPTRVFVGGESVPFVRELMALVTGALAGSDLVSLEGQKHVAMDSAPELFAGEATRFFRP